MIFARRAGRLTSVSLAGAVLAGAVPTGAVLAGVLAASPAAALSARFSWRGIPACGTVSPAFALKGVPRATASLSFEMRDRDAPEFKHGGATVPYAGHRNGSSTGGGTVPRGAVAYVGPCPPKGASHHYIWTIHALDAQGADLDMAEAAGNYPK